MRIEMSTAQPINKVNILCDVQRWTDDMMKWNPAEFGDLESLKIVSDQLWKPDIVVYNRWRHISNSPGVHLLMFIIRGFDIRGFIIRVRASADNEGLLDGVSK